jgi:hypothetical protein
MALAGTGNPGGLHGAASAGARAEGRRVGVRRGCDGRLRGGQLPLSGGQQTLRAPGAKADAIVSFGCGAGVQAISERFPGKPVYPGLNTQFLGILEEQGVWTEKCLGCGDCMLAQFGGICPVTRCAKRMLNGPCGGSTEKQCEVDADRPCAWQLIFTRLKAIGQLDRLDDIVPPKDWSTAWHGGARKIVRPEHRV